MSNIPLSAPIEEKRVASRSSANLDFLRSFAVSLVVLRHLIGEFGDRTTWYFQPQAMGILGVLFFFVHTSLVLMYSLRRQEQVSGPKHLFLAFMIRRCFRIYPLSVVIILFVYFVVMPFDHHGQATLVAATFSPWGLVSNLFLIQNLTHVDSIIGPLWTLPLEVQMYLFLPVLYLLVGRIGTKGLLFVAWPLAVLGAVVQYKFPVLPDLLRYVPCFLPGVIAYTLYRLPKHVPFWMLPMTLIVSLMAYMIVMGRIHAQIFAGMPICLALGLLLPRFSEMRSVALRKVCHGIAQYSYSIYLLHSICLWLAFVVLSGWNVVAQLMIFAATLVAGSFVLYHGVEEPMMKLGNLLVYKRFPARTVHSLSPAR